MKIKGIKNIEFLAKGKRSNVYRGEYKRTKVAIKIFKTKDSKERAKKEANFITILNKNNIGPKLIFQKDNYIVYKLIEGSKFIDWINENNKKIILKIISEILFMCYKMDSLKINKLELTNPKKHILIENNKPIFIDFERCYYTNNPKNLTQFCQYISSKKMSIILKSKSIHINKRKLIGLLRLYKKTINHSNFKLINEFIEKN